MEKFDYEANGYNRKEVNQFVRDVIVETETIINRCKIQAKEIEYLTRELNNYKKLEHTINNTLKQTEVNIEKSKLLATKEAEQILTRAKENANRIVNEALIKANNLDATSKKIEKNIKILQERLKKIVQEQQSIVEEIEVLEIDQ